jgi:hypothetical protein
VEDSAYLGVGIGVGESEAAPADQQNRGNLVKEYVRNIERSIMIHNTRREAHI